MPVYSPTRAASAPPGNPGAPPGAWDSGAQPPVCNKPRVTPNARGASSHWRFQPRLRTSLCTGPRPLTAQLEAAAFSSSRPSTSSGSWCLWTGVFAISLPRSASPHQDHGSPASPAPSSPWPTHSCDRASRPCVWSTLCLTCIIHTFWDSGPPWAQGLTGSGLTKPPLHRPRARCRAEGQQRAPGQARPGYRPGLRVTSEVLGLNASCRPQPPAGEALGTRGGRGVSWARRRAPAER